MVIFNSWYIMRPSPAHFATVRHATTRSRRCASAPSPRCGAPPSLGGRWEIQGKSGGNPGKFWGSPWKLWGNPIGKDERHMGKHDTGKYGKTLADVLLDVFCGEDGATFLFLFLIQKQAKVRRKIWGPSGFYDNSNLRKNKNFTR